MIKYFNESKNKTIEFLKGFTTKDYINMGMLFILIAIVPLIMKQKLLSYPISEFNFNKTERTYIDLFLFYKSQTIVICSATILVLYVLNLFKKIQFKNFNIRDIIPTEILKDKIVIASLVFIFFATISSLFSKYQDVVYSGISQRFEGLFVLISYFIILFATKEFVEKKNGQKVIISFIMFSAFFIAVVGLFQFFKKDLLITDFFVKIILGPYYKPGMQLVQVFNDVYATLYNPNCVGMYTAMIFPFTFILGIFYNKKSVMKYLLLLISFMTLIILKGSSSESAIIALVFEIIICLVLGLVLLLKDKFNVSLKHISIFSATIIILSVFMYIFIKPVNNNINATFLKALNIATPPSQSVFRDMQVVDNSITIDSVNGKIKFVYDKDLKECIVYDKDNNVVTGSKEDAENRNLTVYEIPAFGAFYIQYIGEKMAFYHELGINIIMQIDQNSNIVILDIKEKPIDLNKEIPKIGFEGYELFASSRGFIWSRTLPLLKNKIFLGSGPDSFVLEFPQQDVVGKIRNFGDPNIVVDKAHNLFLQTALSTSIVSLIAMLFIFSTYIITTFKILVTKKIDDKNLFGLELATMISICGYLITSISTDSVVAVAPVFWAMLGLGFATNSIISKSGGANIE